MTRAKTIVSHTVDADVLAAIDAELDAYPVRPSRSAWIQVALVRELERLRRQKQGPVDLS